MLNTDDLRHYTGVGTGYSPELMMIFAADEIDRLRTAIRTALRQLQPNSGYDRDNAIGVLNVALMQAPNGENNEPR